MLKRCLMWAIASLFLAILAGLPPRQATAEDAQREQVVGRINRLLSRIKPTGSHKKDEGDYFVVGTAKLVKATGHADVCFQVQQGQRATAEHLFDFMADASPENPRDWHVFYRVKDGEQAQQALLMARMQYDQLASYREGLKRQYQANSIRRC